MSGEQSSDVQRWQALHLGDWHRYIVGRYASGCGNALEVGCGAGFVMENVSEIIDVSGVDLDEDQLRMAVNRGHRVRKMDGLDLDTEDEYDLVYCSFYLMWVRDMEKAISEMVKAARSRVIMMSEPVWSKAIYHPEDLGVIAEIGSREILERSGFPDAGIRMIEILDGMGMSFRFGTVPVDTSPGQMREHVKFEMDQLEGRVDIDVDSANFFTVPFMWAAIFLD
jgi:SAM-dependent methyltransferase